MRKPAVCCQCIQNGNAVVRGVIVGQCAGTEGIAAVFRYFLCASLIGCARENAREVQAVTGDGKSFAVGEYTATYGENVNVKDGGTVEVTLKGNYSGHATTNFTIGKATTGNKEISDPITLTAANDKAYSVVLPTSLEGVGTLTYGATTVTSSTIPFAADKEPKADNGKKTLTFTTAGGTAAAQTATVTVTVSTANYRDFTFKLTIQLVAKTGVTLTGLSAVPNLKYNGAQHTGYAGTITATDGSGDAVTGLAYRYSYTGINGTSYSSSNAPTNAGSYSLTVSVANSDPKYIGIHAGISFTIAKAPVTVTAGTYAVTKAWDGTTAAGKGSGTLTVDPALPQGVTVSAKPRSYPLSSVGRHKVDVDLTLSGSGNYVLKNSTVEVPGTITSGAVPKAAPAPDAAPVSKSAAAITLQPVAVDGETVEYAKGDDGTTPGTWQDSTTFDNLSPATTYHFFARVAKNTNHGAGTASTGTAITTEKKSSPLIAPKGMTFPVGKTWESNFTVKELLNEWEYHEESPLPKDAKFDSVSGPAPADRKVLDSISIDGTTGELVFESKENPTVPDGVDIFNITVAFGKYESVTFPLTFRNSEKLSATITAKLESKVYDGKAMDLPTPTATSGGAPADLKYTYQWQKDDVSIPGNHAPKDVGNYALVITGKNDTSSGSLTISFMIVKRALTITANSAEIKSGDAAPAYTFTESGLVPGETLTGVKAACSYNNDKDGSISSSKGNYPITVTGGTISGGNDNYTITYVPGTLTVTLDTTALDTAITAAKTAKSGVAVSDQDPKQMTVGVKFVTTAAMAALDAALTGAEASKAGATTNGQIETAAAALTEATSTFEDAIQTGKNVPPPDSVTRYAITATAGEGGSISPEGTVRVQRGKDKAFTITPNEGYVVADVLIDGVSVGAVSTYTFSKVTKAHTISATFRPWTNPYSDVTKQDWFYEAVQTVTQRNLMTGVSANSFNPYGTATRGTIATVLYRQAGSPTVETKETKWYSSAQAWGIKTGISDGANMDREITRQELVTMLHRYAKQMKLDVSIGEDTNILSYNDAFDLPQWSIPAFQWACGTGIVEGADDNLLSNATATRAEVAAMLQRFLTVAAQ